MAVAAATLDDFNKAILALKAAPTADRAPQRAAVIEIYNRILADGTLKQSSGFRVLRPRFYDVLKEDFVNILYISNPGLEEKKTPTDALLREAALGQSDIYVPVEGTQILARLLEISEEIGKPILPKQPVAASEVKIEVSSDGKASTDLKQTVAGLEVEQRTSVTAAPFSRCAKATCAIVTLVAVVLSITIPLAQSGYLSVL